MPDLTFKREERLKSEKIIGALFRLGASVGAYPLRAVWLPLKFDNGPFPVQVSISVPKKAFKKAVDRNKLKRRMREAYRKNKELLEVKSLAVLLVYTSKKQEPYAVIEKSLKSCMLKITKSVAEQV